MRTTSTIPAMLALAVTLTLAPDSARAEARPSPHLAPAGAPKSEFNFRRGFNKDPFFPRAKDDSVVLPPPDKTTSTATTGPTVPDWVQLKGISTTNGRKLAIINNYTVAEGETFTVKANGKSITLQCVEIKEQGVVVSAEGKTKELALRLR